MKKEIRLLFVFVGIFVIALLSIMFGDKYTWTLPAPVPVGAMIIGFWMFMEGITEICREKTDHIFHCYGHNSIREKDIERIPWQEQGEWDEEEGADKKITGTITFAFTNGIDFWGFSLPGSKNDPIVISRSRHFERVRHNHVCRGNLELTLHSELPLFIQDYLIRSHPHRYDSKTTPVLWGMTSFTDGSATSRNLDIERINKRICTEITALRKENADLIEDLERYKVVKEKEKNFVLGKPIKVVGDEE